MERYGEPYARLASGWLIGRTTQSRATCKTVSKPARMNPFTKRIKPYAPNRITAQLALHS